MLIFTLPVLVSISGVLTLSLSCVRMFVVDGNKKKIIKPWYHGRRDVGLSVVPRGVSVWWMPGE